MKLQIRLDNYVRVTSKLNKTWEKGLIDLASIRNEEKDIALREKMRGANNLPDKLTLAKHDDEGNLCLPRGLWPTLQKMLIDNKVPYGILDLTYASDKTIGDFSAPDLRDYQIEAVKAICDNKSGRVIAPPGKGKTVIGLGAIHAINKPTLVLVSKLDLVNQWIARSEEHLGYTPGNIGNQKWNEKEFTVSTFQTLWSKREEIPDEWWNKWHVVIHDEQHHIPAQTHNWVMSKFRAPYRIGFSATVGKSETKSKISELMYGPIIWETEETQLNPTIVKVDTEFKFKYEPTERRRNPKTGRMKTYRNNYQDLQKEIVADMKRNTLITSMICQNPNNANLVISKRLKHFDILKKMVKDSGAFDKDRIWLLTGKESVQERDDVNAAADSGACVIFSTIADEGLDIPRLDRLYRIWPTANPENVKQEVGRICRDHPDKKDAYVFDFCDSHTPVLQGQWNKRLLQYYKPTKLKIIKVEEYLND